MEYKRLGIMGSNRKAKKDSSHLTPALTTKPSLPASPFSPDKP